MEIAAEISMQIPGYKLETELGVGGMATVFRAVQESLHRQVALKVMTPGLSVDETYCHRFLKEGRILAQLNHLNLLTVYDIGVHEDHYYMAMELLPGGTVRDRINAGRGGEDAAKIVADIARGLHYAHAKGFVHRDVKPGNMLFRANGDCVLGDFGIAKAVDSNTGATKLGTSIGTPHYMSPEQAKGEKVDHRTDLYSLGVVFFEMLTGKPPFDADDPFSVALMQINEPVPQLPREHQRFQPLIEKLMAKDREVRYPTAEDFVAALETSMGRAPQRREVPAPSPVRRSKAPVRRSRPGASRAAMRRWKTVALGGAITITLVLVLGVLWRTGLLQPSKAVDNGTVIIKPPDEVLPEQPDPSERVTRQLAEAQDHIRAGRLLAPAGRNALSIYQELVAAHPDNDAVRLAFRELANVVEAAAEKAWAQGEVAGAHRMLVQALEVFPQDQGLQYLLSEILEQHGDQLNVAVPPIQRTPVDRTSETAEVSIADLVAQADRYYAEYKFGHPPGKNAMDLYKEVLKRDPNNVRATNQLAALAEMWADAAQTQISRGNQRMALGMVEMGLRARPEHRRLLGIKQELAGTTEQ